MFWFSEASGKWSCVCLCLCSLQKLYMPVYFEAFYAMWCNFCTKCITYFSLTSFYVHCCDDLCTSEVLKVSFQTVEKSHKGLSIKNLQSYIVLLWKMIQCPFTSRLLMTLFYGCQQTSSIILPGCLTTLLDSIVWVYLNESVTWLLSINQLWFIILLVWTLSCHQVLRIQPLKRDEAQVFRGSLKLLMLLLLCLWFESWWFVGFPPTWMTWM